MYSDDNPANVNQNPPKSSYVDDYLPPEQTAQDDQASQSMQAIPGADSTGGSTSVSNPVVAQPSDQSTDDFNLDDALDKLQVQINKLQEVADKTVQESLGESGSNEAPSQDEAKGNSSGEVTSSTDSNDITNSDNNNGGSDADDDRDATNTKDSDYEQLLVLDQPAKPRRFGRAVKSNRFKRSDSSKRKFGQDLKARSDRDQDQNQPTSSLKSDKDGASDSSKTKRTDKKESTAQNLESQNIFEMLGVADTTTNQEQEAFLDELQQVIWEDFLENDVELLITSKEFTFLQDLLATDKAEQSKIFQYLQKLIPDLSLIMTEKALELKQELFEERLAALEEHFANNDESLGTVDKAKKLLSQNRWTDAVQAINELSTNS